MAVAVIGDVEKAALYDTVTETAFGPTFDDKWDAEDFLEWFDKNYETDLRKQSNADIRALKEEWEEQRDNTHM